MKEMFTHYIRPTDSEIKSAWESSLFAVDTNVLLNLYRYPDDARDNLLEALEALNDRLWIPHQAALEFHENRLSVLAEQANRFKEVEDIVDRVQSLLITELDKLQLRKRHSKINPDNFLQTIDAIVSDFKQSLSSFRVSQPQITDDDPLLDRLDKLFAGKIGSPPATQDCLNKIYKEGNERFDYHIPPGYEDYREKSSPKSQKKAYKYGDLAFRSEYGDLILWYELIEEAKSRNSQSVIFVTDDQKEDWWWIEKSYGKKVIGPRPELIQEIRQKGNVTFFWMYNSERFLEFARDFLNIVVERETIEQVRDITEPNPSVPEISLSQDKSGVDEDLGFLELLGEFNDASAQATLVMNRIAELLNWIGERTQSHANQLTQLTLSKSKLGADDIKPIIGETAGDMNKFSSEMEAQIPYFAHAYEKAITRLKYFLVLSNDQDTIERNLRPLQDMVTNIIPDTMRSILSLRQTINNMPRITKDLNQAKKRAVEVLDKLLSALETANQQTQDLLSNFGSSSSDTPPSNDS